MATQKKGKKFNWKNQYDFSVEGGLTEKQQFTDIKRNPTAIIYVRVSDPKQVSEGNGLESQEATCRRWAESKGIAVLRVFSDGGISGATFERKGLEEAIAYLKQENKPYPKISHFLCTEISRISRSENTNETGAMKQIIESTGVHIITTSNGMDISNKTTTNEFMTDIQIAVAKNERLQIRDRSINGSKAKLYNGERIFSAPVGYEKVHIKINGKMEKRLQKVEPQASIIKEGLELFADGILANNTALLAFFNEKNLKSNFHSPNP
jgi:DNA invertase Pin-like site-specific DNA recombinase